MNRYEVEVYFDESGSVLIVVVRAASSQAAAKLAKKAYPNCWRTKAVEGAES